MSDTEPMTDERLADEAEAELLAYLYDEAQKESDAFWDGLHR